jgi:hypothetical protein
MPRLVMFGKLPDKGTINPARLFLTNQNSLNLKKSVP